MTPKQEIAHPPTTRPSYHIYRIQYPKRKNSIMSMTMPYQLRGRCMGMFTEENED